jgi:hypothetical protein
MATQEYAFNPKVGGAYLSVEPQRMAGLSAGCQAAFVIVPELWWIAMRRPAVARGMWWRRVCWVFLLWTLSVYLLSALTVYLMLRSQGLLNDWGFHLTFLIPAVSAGSVGACY